MIDNPDHPNRKQRRAAGTENFDEAVFLKVADKFITLANRENRTVKATDLHMAFLYASARYSAHVAKAVLDVSNHEDFVGEITKTYQEMLRQNLADESLDRTDGS